MDSKKMRVILFCIGCFLGMTASAVLAALGKNEAASSFLAVAVTFGFMAYD